MRGGCVSSLSHTSSPTCSYQLSSLTRYNFNVWAQCWVSVYSLQAFTEHFSNDSRFSDTQCNVSHVISNLLFPIIITTILFSHLAVHWKNSVPYDICGGKSGQNWEKYLWENLFVPFQSCLWSDCHIDRLQILIGKKFSPMTRWHTAVSSRNIRWEYINGKTISTLFLQTIVNISWFFGFFSNIGVCWWYLVVT